MVILGLVCLVGCMNRPNQEEMITELKKPEVVEVIEKSIKNIDKQAFTDSGVIKSYELDYNTVKYNPMGGISAIIYINKDTNLYYKFILNKRNNIYSIGATTYSSKLDDLLKNRWLIMYRGNKILEIGRQNMKVILLNNSLNINSSTIIIGCI